MFQFVHPAWLFAVIPAWYLYHRFVPDRGLQSALRYLLLLITIAIAAGPVGLRPDRGSIALLLFDQSQSMPSSLIGHKARLIAEANAQRHEGDQLAVIRFGGIPLVEQYPDNERPPQTNLNSNVDPDRTNLHQAIAAALDLIPPRSPARILLVSDGQADDELSDELLAALRRRDVQVSFQQFPPADLQGDVIVESVEGPTSLKQGDELQLRVQVTSDRAAAAAFRIRQDNAEVAYRSVPLEPGLNTLAWSQRCNEHGAFHFSISVEQADDPLPGNNVWSHWVQVSGPRSALVIHPAVVPSSMSTILRDQGLNVVSAGSNEVPASLEKLSQHSLCVLEDVGIKDLPADMPGLLVSYVERLGGGLIVTGGKRSFGNGAIRSSPLAPLLPVALRPLNVGERPAQAVVIMVDPSAWDAQNQLGLTPPGGKDDENLTQVQKAMLALGAELDPADRIGIVTTRLPDPVFLPLTVPNKRDVRDSIVQLGFSSDRSAFPRALQSAWEMLASSSQPEKHLVVIVDTDQLASWPPEPVDPIVRQPIKGASLTVVVWGSLDPAVQAHWVNRMPGGRMLATSNTQELINLLRTDWELTTGGSYVNRSTNLVGYESGSSDPGVPGRQSPAVDGFHTAMLRDGAEGIAYARDVPRQPMIARWDRGLGRVATLLFPVRSAQTPTLDQLIADQATWTGRIEQAEAVPSAELVGQSAHVRADLSNMDLEANSAGELVDLVLTTGDGVEAGRVRMARDGDRWTARFPLESTQSYLGSIQQGKRWIGRTPPVALPRSAEFLRDPDQRDGRSVLERLAVATGGSEWHSGHPLFDDSGDVLRSLVPFYACFGLGVLLLDLAERRYGVLRRFQTRWTTISKQRREAESRAIQRASDRRLDGDPFELAKERTRRRVQR